MLGVVSADLRQAAWPKKTFKLRQDNGGRGGQNFVAATSQTLDGAQKGATDNAKGVVFYNEPNTFEYQGLKNQRNNNYDNFLRSNIDNEQDNRNFNTERGLDMQPFRTCESQAPLTYPHNNGGNAKCDGSLQNQNGGQTMNVILKAVPGEPRMTPLRWNNPHASEIEVNLWIMCSDPPTIVPVKKPTCSGEGNQNNILQWAIPSDFNEMDWKSCPSTACFDGCKKAGDCQLQIYAHSVETRQYSSATPIIIEGTKTTFQGTRLQYSAIPKDNAEAKSYVYPEKFDLEAMVLGVEPADPSKQGQRTKTGQVRNTQPVDPVANLKVCASPDKNGVKDNGDEAVQKELGGMDNLQTLNSPQTHLYICKLNDAQIQAESTVDKVYFEVFTSTGVNAAFTTVQGGQRIENYSPYEFSDLTNHFGGAGIKKIKVTITLYDTTQPIVKEVYLDLRSAQRWRFRRHLLPACPGGLQEPAEDVRFNLAALNRETCMPSTDPNANYDKTTLQRAVLHSDVANHAYQNSDYSPYMGQQAGEISRTMQAAAIVHMTSGNRGELGKNMIPNQVKQLVKTLNKKVNNIYQNYEKVANKIIDDLSKAQKDGQGATVGAQQLGVTFRSAAKGATSTKRLKTTTYVPSFEVANYDKNVINNAIQQRTGGNKNAYKDILTAANPTTNKEYIMIYTTTLNQMLPDFQKAAEYGVTYQGSIQKVPCSVLKVQNKELYELSKLAGNNEQPADCCCEGNLLNTAPGGCGATFNSRTEHIKKNAAGKKDGGRYAAETFMMQHYNTMYNCDALCIKNTENPNNNLAQALTKTSKGTCVTYLNGEGLCVNEKTAGGGDTDCRGCSCIYDNAAPSLCELGFGGGNLQGVDNSIQLPVQDFNDIRQRIQAPPKPEPGANIRNAGGFAQLSVDDTAICHTESKYKCPDDNKEFLTEQEIKVRDDSNQCAETPGVKIDAMCQDTPCDKDPDSSLCLTSLERCKYDPDSGVMCQPKSPNDPCEDCLCYVDNCFDNKYSVYGVDSGNSAYLALTSMIVLAAVL